MEEKQMKRDLKTPLAATWPSDPPAKDKTLSMGSSSADEGRFAKRKTKTAADMKNDRRALAKDLRTGKIDYKTYKSKVGSTRTAQDKNNLKKNAGHSASYGSDFRGPAKGNLLCGPKSGGSCSPKYNKTLGGKF